MPCLPLHQNFRDTRHAQGRRADMGPPGRGSWRAQGAAASLHHLAAAALMTVMLASAAGCASAPAPPELRLQQPVVLLGEVHDNAVQHALRLQAFETLLAGGARPALVMEQFDRERQPVIDALREKSPPPDADALISAAGGAGWEWRHYRPFVALALQHGLPIVAANVSREEARRVMAAGLQASGFDADVAPDVLLALAADIEDSHCGLIDGATARRMALAQVARATAMCAPTPACRAGWTRPRARRARPSACWRRVRASAATSTAWC